MRTTSRRGVALRLGKAALRARVRSGVVVSRGKRPRKAGLTAEQFVNAQFHLAQQLGSAPSVSRVREAIRLLEEAGAPADADWSALVQALIDAKARAAAGRRRG